MRQALNRLIDELHRLKEQGYEGVEVSDRALSQLKSAVEHQATAAKPPKLANPPQQDTPKNQAQPASTLRRGIQTQPELVQAPSSAAPVQPRPAVPASSADPARPHPAPAQAAATPVLPPPPVLSIPAGSKPDQLAWLRDRVLSCPVCNSNLRPGKKLVFGEGSPDASIFFCGEAPGADEEIQGIPFVGEAGKLLTRIIQAMGLSRDTVYIGNIMKWRPDNGSDYGNRPPTVEEMAFCLPYLEAQLSIIRPQIIVGLGATALNGLLGYNPERRITSVRGQWFQHGSIPVMATFHPSYVNRNGTNRIKRMIWEDMLAVMERAGLPISPKQQAYFT